MSLLAEFDATSPEMFLGPTLDAMPSLTVELERQYALDPARPISFCWMQWGDADVLDRTLAGDETVDAFGRVARTDAWELYRIRRSATDVVDAYRRWVDAGGELLASRAVDGRWELEMRFPDRASFTGYHEFLMGCDVDVDIHRLTADGRTGRYRGHETLTESQREALVLAYEYGFFEVPRNTTLTAIADTLEISDQAVSERLRRGQARLIAEHLR